LTLRRIGKIVLTAASVTGLYFAVPCGNAFAGVVETVREDLRPVSGYVVDQQESEYLVDLDARHGLRVGDLLSVVTRGQEVIHPITKEVLGRLDEAKAVLQVTRMKSGFSVARPVSGPANIAKGDIVRRFAHIKTAFQGSESQDKALYEALREALPELEWQGLFLTGEKPGGTTPVDLVFSLGNDELRLLDREGQTLRTWAYSAAAEPVPQKPVAEAPRQPAPAVSTVPPPAGVPSPPEKDLSQVRWAADDVDYGPFTSLGEMPDRVVMAAFARDADRILFATVDGDRVRVFTVTGGLQLLAVTKVRGEGVSPLGVAWWRPEKTGALYLAVTAVEEISRDYGTKVEMKQSGTIFQFDGQSLLPVVSGLGYFLGTFDRDGDGLPETLLGQEFHLNLEFGRTFVLTLEGGNVSAGKPGFDLPTEFTVPGSTMVDLTGDGKPEIAMVRNGVLWIYSGKERIYTSSSDMGGSISTFTYNVNPSAADTIFQTLALEVPPYPRDIDGDGVTELLVVGSETSSMKAPGFGPGIKKSWVNVVKFQNGAFHKGRLPGERENALQGIWADTEKVYLIESRTTSVLTKKGSSNLLTHPLGRSGN
jgi:hypothetical protein